jgi:CHAT domain-containing protein
LPRLPFTRIEATAIMSTAPDHAAQWLDFDASKPALLGPDIGRYRIVHVASHTFVDDLHPELSSIVLSTVDRVGNPVDGFVRLEDIFNMRLEAELAVLSACETGTGTPVRGEGVIGLTRGFMYAGTPRVIFSLWKVDDSATAELMKLFYRNLFGSSRLPPSAALRNAQIAISRQARWASPYYWAGFELQGEWR